MTTEVKAFRCDHHPRARLFTTKSSAKRHEAGCLYNPANRSCKTCAYYVEEEDLDGFLVMVCEDDIISANHPGLVFGWGKKNQILRRCEAWSGELVSLEKRIEQVGRIDALYPKPKPKPKPKLVTFLADEEIPF